MFSKKLFYISSKLIIASLISTGMFLQTGCSDKKVDEHEKFLKELENVSTKVIYELVKRDLKDPESAQFRNVSYYSNSIELNGKNYPANHVLCGEVNAKNSFGGYVGYSEFVGTVMISLTNFAVESPYVYMDDTKSGLVHENFLKIKKQFCTNSVQKS